MGQLSQEKNHAPERPRRGSIIVASPAKGRHIREMEGTPEEIAVEEDKTKAMVVIRLYASFKGGSQIATPFCVALAEAGRQTR